MRAGKAVMMVLSPCRFIVGAEFAGASTGGQALHERLACLICSRVLGCLAAVLSQARLLTPKEQVAPLPSCCPHSCVGYVLLLDAQVYDDTCPAPASRHGNPYEGPFCARVQVDVAGALSSVAVYAARRSFQLQTPGAAAGTQSPAIPEGPFVLDQVACSWLTCQTISCLVPKGASQCVMLVRAGGASVEATKVLAKLALDSTSGGECSVSACLGLQYTGVPKGRPITALAERCMKGKPLPEACAADRELPRSSGLHAQVSGYLQVLLASIDGPVVLEAASGILALAKVADRVLAAAPVLAIAAFMDLWDHDSSSVSHAQIMEAVCANLDVLQVVACAS